LPHTEAGELLIVAELYCFTPPAVANNDRKKRKRPLILFYRYLPHTEAGELLIVAELYCFTPPAVANNDRKNANDTPHFVLSLFASY